MIYYLYEIKNCANGMIYVGVHKTCNLDDGYMGSGTRIRRAIAKYGVEAFSKTIMETFDDEDSMYAREKAVVDFDFISRLDTYNIVLGGRGGDTFSNHPDREMIREKFNNRCKHKNGMFGKRHRPESIEAMRQNRRGRGIGIATWNKGLTMSDDWRTAQSIRVSGSNNGNCQKIYRHFSIGRNNNNKWKSKIFL